MDEQTLIQLANLVMDFMEAKTDEEHAKEDRIAIEEKIAALVPTSEKGQKTVTLGDMKLTVKRDLNYKADMGKIQRIFDAGISDGHEFLAAPLRSKTVCELDVTGYEWYRKEHPDIFKQLTEHVEVKPKKVAISVKKAK
jgi:hypothetical protein